MRVLSHFPLTLTSKPHPLTMRRPDLTWCSSAWPKFRSPEHRLSESSVPIQGDNKTEKWRPQKIEQRRHSEIETHTHTPGWEKSRWGETRKRPFQTFPSFQPDVYPSSPPCSSPKSFMILPSIGAQSSISSFSCRTAWDQNMAPQPSP